MVYLPTELWDRILLYAEQRDIWLKIRPVNTQLRSCAERHLRDHWLKRLTLILPISIPSYDMRNPGRGQAEFRSVSKGVCLSNSLPCIERAIFVLEKTDPAHRREHFVARFKGLKNAGTGKLDYHKEWLLQSHLGERAVTVHLEDAFVDFTSLDGEDAVWLSCDYKFLATSYFGGGS